MVNELGLREVLLALTEIAKSQTEQIASLHIELSAVRETVRALDPTFDDSLAGKRQKIREAVIPSFAGAVGTLQLLSAKLKAGDVC